ncbi:MAG: prephenate dehydratase domain-containing protein [Eubacteriales bacterium]
MVKLDELRVQIDDIDRQLVELYEKRMKISEEVGKFKIEAGRPVFDKEREISKLNTVEAMATSSFNQAGVRELFENIMSGSRKLQYRLLSEHDTTVSSELVRVDSLNCKQARVIFQGIPGAYSQMALHQYFGQDVTTSHVETFRDAMVAIEEGRADYAVLPIENSSAGAVTQVYDLLVEYDNYIIGEVKIPIEHTLSAIAGAKVEDITRVYSHPQALMQSMRFLEKHRGMEQISVTNTALAAKKVIVENDMTQAAICSEYAANLYGLEVLKRKINHNDNNSTRFIVVTNQRIFVNGATKISTCFEIPHESGSLYRLLSNIIFNNLNMTKIESRPIEGRSWEYRFFVDFDGEMDAPGVKNALRGIREESKNLRILGNY